MSGDQHSVTLTRQEIERLRDVAGRLVLEGRIASALAVQLVVDRWTSSGKA